mgnify:CR=1 FL=1
MTFASSRTFTNHTLKTLTNTASKVWAWAGTQSEGEERAAPRKANGTNMFTWVLHQDPGEHAEEVAIVHAPHKMKVEDFLEYAWEQTNHINHDWTTNPSVELRTTKRPRSSMVGDIFCVYWTGLFGQPKTAWYRVGMVGFYPWQP